MPYEHQEPENETELQQQLRYAINNHNQIYSSRFDWPRIVGKTIVIFFNNSIYYKKLI